MTDITTAPVAPNTRQPLDEMTDAEVIREIAQNLRDVHDALAELEQSPVIAAMKNGSGIMGMLRA